MSAFEIIGGVYYLKYNRIDNILLSSSMYERFKAEPQQYTEQIAFYNSLNDNYYETKRFTSITSKPSRFDIINIYNNINYVIQTKKHGTVGPTLIFYKAEPKNYIPYVFSSPIYFDDANKSFDRYYIRGLSGQEEHGVWTLGRETEFLFYLGDSYNDLKFSFYVSPLISADISTQVVDVVANGEFICAMEIKETGVYNVVIPNSAITDSRLEILFILPTATSPKELGINNDDRILSLFITEMSISEVC